MAFRGDYRGDVTTVLFIQPKQSDISILMLAFGLLSETRGDQELIACFNDLIDVNRLSRYVRASIIIPTVVFAAPAFFGASVEDEFAGAGLRDASQKLLYRGNGIAFIGLQSPAFFEGRRPVPEVLVLFPFHRGQA